MHHPTHILANILTKFLSHTHTSLLHPAKSLAHTSLLHPAKSLAHTSLLHPAKGLAHTSLLHSAKSLAHTSLLHSAKSLAHTSLLHPAKSRGNSSCHSQTAVPYCSHAYWCLVQLGTLVAGYQVNICLSAVTHANLLYTWLLILGTHHLRHICHTLVHWFTLTHSPTSHTHT